MSIRKILSLFFVILVVELVALALVLSLIVAGQRGLAETETRRYQAYKLADELRQSSDNLTRMARTYVATGDSAFEQHFRDILAIRDGKKPRPRNYDRIHWDFVVAGKETPTEAGPAISLSDRMATLNLTSEELEELRLAKANSDALVSLENEAMNAVKGLFDDGSQGYTVRRTPDLDLARSIMFGNDYHAAKAAIMRPIDNFLVSLENRMNSAVVKQRARVDSHLTIAAFVVALTLVSFGTLAIVIRRRLISPVNKLVEQSEAIRKGDYGYQVAPFKEDDEIGVLAGALNRMSTAISDDIENRRQSEEERLRQSQKMDVLGQLTSSVAHDFNNILTVLDCNIGLLKSQNISQEQQQSLIKDCLGAVELGSNLTSRLTNFARKEPLAETKVDLNKLIVGFSDLLNRSLGEDVSFEFVLSDDPLPALVDIVLVEVGLLNLAINARDAMPEGGMITVSLSKTIIDGKVESIYGNVEQQPYALLQVSDTGIGMAPEIKKRVFEAFFTTKDEGKGTGLGLSTVRDLAQSAGGFVQIESKLKKGTAVKIFLPLYEEEVS